jgi:hypothetical protein
MYESTEVAQQWCYSVRTAGIDGSNVGRKGVHARSERGYACIYIVILEGCIVEGENRAIFREASSIIALGVYVLCSQLLGA